MFSKRLHAIHYLFSVWEYGKGTEKNMGKNLHKNVFSTDFNLYKKLHKYIQNVCMRFIAIFISSVISDRIPFFIRLLTAYKQVYMSYYIGPTCT